MQTLRNAHRIARFVLLWFAMSLGVAMASPMVKPQALQLVCSAAGNLQWVGDDGNSSARQHTLDCPLCAGLGTVLPPEALAWGPVVPRHTAPAVSCESQLPVALALPPPARGPPRAA